MEDLRNEVHNHYDFDIKSIARYMDGYKLTTKSGEKYLKKMRLSPGRVLFIHGFKEHLALNGFEHIDRYILTKDKKPYMLYETDCYTVTDIPQGRECDFNVLKDVKQAAKALARLHKASLGYEPPEGCLIQDGHGKLVEVCKRRLKELQRLKNQAKRVNGEVDYIFLSHVDFYYEMGMEAVTELDEIYKNIRKLPLKERNVCHYEFSHRNVRFSSQGAFISGFDNCKFEERAFDISELLRRRIKKAGWHVDEAFEILEAYNEVYPVTSTDKKMIGLILQFPYQFWTNTNRFYNSRRSWSEKVFREKIGQVVEEKDEYINFLKAFKSMELQADRIGNKEQ